jgi:hypothetical protein
MRNIVTRKSVTHRTVIRKSFEALFQYRGPCFRTTTAAADTSSEVVKKIRDRFLKDASKVVVKLLDPYRRPDAVNGRIQSVEDFKHLAKKVGEAGNTKGGEVSLYC